MGADNITKGRRREGSGSCGLCLKCPSKEFGLSRPGVDILGMAFGQIQSSACVYKVLLKHGPLFTYCTWLFEHRSGRTG